MDNGNSIHNKNVNYNDEYYEVHNVAASVHNNESMTYQTYNNTVCDTAISDIVIINTLCIDNNDRLFQVQDTVSSGTDSNTDSIYDAHRETPSPSSTIGKPMFSPKPFDTSKFTNSYQHCHSRYIGQPQTHTVK